MSTHADPVKLASIRRGENTYIGQGKSGRTRLRAITAELEPGTYDVFKTTGGRTYVRLRDRPNTPQPIPLAGLTVAGFFKKGYRS